MFKIDPAVYPAGALRFAEALIAEGVNAWGRYIGRCVYRYELFNDAYPLGLCPDAEKVLEECVLLKLNQAYGMHDIYAMAEAIRKVYEHRDTL
jgi:hypothetical protein